MVDFIKGPIERKEFVKAYANEVGAPVEMFSIEDQKDRLVLANESIIDLAKQETTKEAIGWLPFFAERYGISKDIKDYILVPTTIMPSDLPNRNAQAFPYEELTRPDPEIGLLAYQTWKAMPTFKDHKNQLDKDPTKGIILSSTMRRIPNSYGDLWKVVVLNAFDRSKDPMLANDILTGKRSSYSMGAWSRHFTCSVCAAVHTSKVEGCDHVSVKSLRMRVMPDNKLAYLNAHYPKGFECSSVDRPAFATAVTSPENHLK